MRVALIAPLMEAVPPRRYGGTERVVSSLADALSAKGHQVTVFANGESRGERGSRRLSGPFPADRRTADRGHRRHHPDARPRPSHGEPVRHPPFPHRIASISRFFEGSRRQDRDSPCHSRLDHVGLPHFFRRSAGNSRWSRFSRRPRGASLPDANWVATIHHGYPLDLFRHRPGETRQGTWRPISPFLAGSRPDKGIDTAIEIARRAKTAAQDRCADKLLRQAPYWEQAIKAAGRWKADRICR